MIYISLLVAWVSYMWADHCEEWSFAWWFNMFASALNFVIFVINFMAL